MLVPGHAADSRCHQLMCLHHLWLKHAAEVTCTISQVNTSPRMTLLGQVHQVCFQVFSPDVQRSLCVSAAALIVDLKQVF